MSGCIVDSTRGYRIVVVLGHGGGGGGGGGIGGDGGEVDYYFIGLLVSHLFIISFNHLCC